jgi:type II secretory pathway predicted ATPase ExeA
MKTSSGDKLSLNFENTQELSLSSQEDGSSKKESFAFSSLQAFSFTIDSNGISEQDQKEIDVFMEKAQPYIDKFMKELEEQNQNSPINKIASDIVKNLGNLKESSENVKNSTKKEIVDLFDKALENNKSFEKMVEESQKLLQKIIDGFDKVFEPLYA